VQQLAHYIGIHTNDRAQLVRTNEGSRSGGQTVDPLLLFRGVFVPTQVINFAIVPGHLRLVVVGVVSVFWSKFEIFFLPAQ
jgi:hypothetical protein